MQWYFVRCGFTKVKARDGPLVPVNHYCAEGPNAMFTALRGNAVLYSLMSLQKCLILGNKKRSGAARARRWTAEGGRSQPVI